MRSRVDIEFMRGALALARRGLGRTSPNPCVGAVLAHHGKVIGKGWHRAAGSPHAEVEAIRNAQRAGRKVIGATLYVTLEPCCTRGKTPPCTDAIRAAGIKRVVTGATDPNPKHSGRGFGLLRKAAIQVVKGVLKQECEELNRGWNHWIVHRTPWVLAKCGMTLDGKIATADGQSQWITGEKARREGRRLRSRVDAVLVGVNTVLKDDPVLTVRLSRWTGKQPLRVILDTHARTPPHAKIFEPIGRNELRSREGRRARLRPYGSYGHGECENIDLPLRNPVWIFVGQNASEKRVERLRRSGANVILVPVGADPCVRPPGLDLNLVLKKLGEAEIVSVLVEGGGNVLGSFFSQGKVNEVIFFVAPMILGGQKSVKAVAGDGVPMGRGWPILHDFRLEKVGCDLMIAGVLERDSPS